MKYRSFALIFSLTGTLTARPFTDVSGKVIEAEFVSLVGETVTISKQGHPFKLPLARFSAADQEFIHQQSATAPAQTPSAQVNLDRQMGTTDFTD